MFLLARFHAVFGNLSRRIATVAVKASVARVTVAGIAAASMAVLAAFSLSTVAPMAQPAPAQPRTPARPLPVGVVQRIPGHPVLRLGRGAVRGTVIARVGKEGVFLNDFPVYLKRTGSNVVMAPEKTDAYGRYYFRSVPNGNYSLCWSPPDWLPGCAETPVHVRSNLLHLAEASVIPARTPAIAAPSAAPVWGRVTLADGTSPWFFDPYFGVRQDVTVTVSTTGGAVVAKVRTNAAGQFVFPRIGFGTYKIAADAGGGSVLGNVAVGQGNPLSLKIPNYRPSIVGVTASLGGAPRHEVPASATLDVAADVRDPEHQALKIVWKAAPAEGQVSGSGANVQWQLPGRPGILALYVLADDGHGGIATSNVSVSAGTDVTWFGVHLVDSDTGKAVTKAAVTVNGAKASLSSNGLFVAKTKIANRYVVNADAPDYIFMSRIFDAGGVYREMKLVHATVTTVDPTKNVVLVDTRKNLRQYGYVETAPASISIKAGTLIGPKGAKASGPLRAQIAALDISSEQFPGDNGALVSGKDVGMISYGAMDVVLRDSAGNRMQLAHGAMADVVIPVPYTMKKPPADIALWYYNQSNGFWEPLKQKAKYDPAKHAYVGRVPHLSAFNVDLDQPDLACFRVLLDNIDSNTLKGDITYVSGGTPFPPAHNIPLFDALNVIKRLPPNSTVHFSITDTAGQPVDRLSLLDENQAVVGSVGTSVAATAADVQTGPASLPHFPPAPYANCKTFSLRLQALPGSAEEGRYLSAYSGLGDEPTTRAYYLGFDPAMSVSGGGVYSGGQHSTLGSWWTNVAGFDATTGDAADQTRQAFLNYNDLGFGRDMHIREDGSGVYAYVTNYANQAVPDQNPLNAVYAQNRDPSKVIATVAMQSRAFGGMNKVVSFWVYVGANQNAPLVPSADLDGFGQKFVPQLCQVCHGGQPYFPANASAPTQQELALRTSATAVGAVMREFDLHTYVFPGDTTPGNFGVLSAADLQAFFNLNQHVISSGTQPIMVDLIHGFNPNATTFDPNWTPTTWVNAGASAGDLYRATVAKGCRTCHIAFDQSDAYLQTLNWQDYNTFKAKRSGIQADVCSASKRMPHALMTYRDFWLGSLGGDYGPQKLANYSAAGWAAFGVCQ